MVNSKLFQQLLASGREDVAYGASLDGSASASISVPNKVREEWGGCVLLLGRLILDCCALSFYFVHSRFLARLCFLSFSSVLLLLLLSTNHFLSFFSTNPRRILSLILISFLALLTRF